MKKFIKRTILLILLLLFINVLFGCEMNRTPLTASFRNLTSAGSTNNTFSVAFAKDKQLENYYGDLIVNSQTDNLVLKISKEGGEVVEIVLPSKEYYYSLTKLMNEKLDENKKLEYKEYKQAVSQTYIITSNQDANLNIKAVAGELENDKSGLKSMFEISKPFEFKIKQNKKV